VQRGSREHIEAALERRGKERRAVKARKGDTLAKLGKRFGLTDGDLARINGYARDHELAPGELVVVYVDAGTTRGTVGAPTPRVSSGRDDALAGRDAAVTGRDDADSRDEDEPASARTTASSDDAAPPKRPRARKHERRRAHDPSTPGTSRVPGRAGEPR
jgi:membrane-bound lytic murein transglycosylase D